MSLNKAGSSVLADACSAAAGFDAMPMDFKSAGKSLCAVAAVFTSLALRLKPSLTTFGVVDLWFMASMATLAFLLFTNVLKTASESSGLSSTALAA